METNREAVLQELYKRATGYEQVEEITEYVIDEDGGKRAVKEKRQVKQIPPDVNAIKLYVEQLEKDNNLTHLTDEELEREKVRIIATLASGAKPI